MNLLFGTYGNPTLSGLGDAPPIIKYNTEPDTSADGRKVDWSCSDWITWHQLLVQAFTEGRFASGIKYSREKALEHANNVWRTWWDKSNSWFGYNKSFCGYESLFFNYLSSVGLADVLNLTHKVYNPATDVVVSVANTTKNVAESGLTTAENVAKAAENTAGATKWLAPTLLVVAAVGVGVWAYKNFLSDGATTKPKRVKLQAA